MTSNAELEAQIRARDAISKPYEIPHADREIQAVNQVVIDRRTLLRLLDEARKSWRCFHCDEVFTDRAAALEHFGESMCDDPACQIDMADVRAMENQLRQYREEDTHLHRELLRIQTDHLVALRREEESGYSKGVRDMTKDRDEETHQFQNFHRLLCERFGYGHDPVDWRRDQLSLIEHIASRLAKAQEKNVVLLAVLDWALNWHIAPTVMKEGKLGWGHAPNEAICDALNQSRDRIMASPCFPQFDMQGVDDA